jgi:DNA-binding NarL/FixJ family response regulator
VKNSGAMKAFQRRRVRRSYAGATKIESLNREEQTGKENVRLEEGRREPARSAFHIRILSIDGHPLFREGIGALINSQADMSLVSAVETGKEGIDAYRAAKPDVTLLDLQLSDISGIEVLMGIRSEFPDARIIILATFQRDVEIRRALTVGAFGYILKSMTPEQILETIRRVHSGGKCVPREIAAGLAEHLTDDNLSEREIEILRHVADGERNREIGEKLCISEETVKVHLRRIMGKLSARDRTQAVAIAVRRGIIQL